MVAPDPALAPVTFVEDCTVQVNVVPDTLVGVDAIETFVLVPLQMVWFDAVAVGTGFTVTT